MANSKAERLSGKVAGAKGRLLKRPGKSARSPEASLAAIQKTGWTPEAEVELLSAPALGQIQLQSLDNLVQEAGARHDPNLWRLLAGICERRNEDQHAILYATEALQIQPDDVATMTLLARLWEKRHAETEAVGWYQRILALDSTNVAANQFFAQLHYRRGEYAPALLHLTRLVEAEPKAHIHKLYVLLTKVKSAGVLGLAQPLTEVRRWRSFAPEEVPLAHELFVLVGKECLQANQRARAKQYFTRALQLVPSAEVESLLAQVSDQHPPSTPATKAPLHPSHLSSSMSRERRSLPPLPSVVLSDPYQRSKIYGLFTSSAGFAAATVVVALFGIWTLVSTPERRTIIELEDEEDPVTEEAYDFSRSEQKVIPSPPNPSRPQPQVATVPPPPAVLPTAKDPPAQREIRTPDFSTPPTKPTGNPIPPQAPLAKENITAQPAPLPSLNTTTEVASLERDPVPPPAPPPSVSPRQPVVKKEAAKPKAAARASEKKTNVSTSIRPGEKEARAALPPDPPVTALAPAPAATAPAVEEKLTEGSAPPTAKSEALLPGSTNSESTIIAAVEKSESATTIPEPPATSPPLETASPTPLVEEKRTEEPTFVAGAQAPPPPLTVPPAESVAPTESLPPTQPAAATESVRTEAPSSSNEAGEERTVTAAVVEEQPPAPAVDTQTPAAAADAPDREEQKVTEERAPTRTVANASGAIARLSSRSPHTARFPTRERVVSAPPRQLLSTMKTLMKQETGASSIGTPVRGVLRARVSGKRPAGTRTQKMYGQYLVEVLPGPTEGTSRVRAKALMFDWRTGQPVENADSLADRLLEKVGE
jgi:tetratricopeptide (TPR) repeat protein